VPEDRPSQFTFIDLFAGIGGTRLGFEKAGGECVFSSEWDDFAQKTYESNFGEKPLGDIRKINAKDIPDHDVLVAGFPCQPFSIAGVSKKNSLSRAHGFEDKTQGTLFFEIARILKEKKPNAFVLENVKNLKSHNKGETYQVILDVLKNDLGYTVYDNVIDASAFVPQHRERIFIVGFKRPVDFSFPIVKNKKNSVKKILEDNVHQKYTLSDKLWKYLQNYARKHLAKGNGFGFGLANPDGITRTLSARYYKDGSAILIPQDNKNPRRLTPRECARLMGFPEKFKITVSDTQAYKQFGNSVVVPVIESVAKEVAKKLGSKEITDAKNRVSKKYSRTKRDNSTGIARSVA
jgi:DNA (cytosine-5)-methyltransferase 1